MNRTSSYAPSSILVIDDDVQFNKMVCLILEQAGFAVRTAFNGSDGLKQFLLERPDLVITDIYMPEKEGLETIMALKAVDGGIKILVVSGGSPQLKMAEMFNLAQLFGADAMLAKPFDIDTFLKVVRGLLAKAV